jgi:hypothetical protein
LNGDRKQRSFTYLDDIAEAQSWVETAKSLTRGMTVNMLDLINLMEGMIGQSCDQTFPFIRQKYG